MELTQNQSLKKVYVWAVLKSFLIWSFTLTVCWLVAGFPIVAIIVTASALLAIALQSVLPISAVLVVAGGMIGINLLAVFVSAAMLTFRGIHPQDVSWLSWLHGKASPLETVTFASCPFACALED